MTIISGRHPHVFGRARATQGGRYPIHIAPERDTDFRDLPLPTGSAPFHLDLRDIIAQASYQTIVDEKKLTFHVNGTWGVSSTPFRRSSSPKAWKRTFQLRLMRARLRHFYTSRETVSISTVRSKNTISSSI